MMLEVKPVLFLIKTISMDMNKYIIFLDIGFKKESQ